MSDADKAARAAHRQQDLAVRDYLEALETHRPKRGRKRTEESIRKRIAAIDSGLDSASPLQRLQLTQERLDLTQELNAMENAFQIKDLEDGFIEAAADYGARKGISYAAWRDVGVDPAVLRKAGVQRSR